MRESDDKAFEFASDTTKQLLTLSTGVLALTITFLIDVAGSSAPARWLLGLAWLCYLSSVLAGVGTLMALTGNLERANNGVAPTTYAGNVRKLSAVQISAFALGLVLTVAFGAIAL